MCVYISEDGGKVVTLPPFVVIARRINNVQLELILERLRLTWNPGTGTFDMEREGGGVSIVTIDRPLPPPKPEDTRQFDSWRVCATTIVNGYVLHTIEFLKNGVVVAADMYIHAGGEFWATNSQGVWFSTPGFSSGDTWRVGVLPPPAATPPEGRGGDDNIAQH